MTGDAALNTLNALKTSGIDDSRAGGPTDASQQGLD